MLDSLLNNQIATRSSTSVSKNYTFDAAGSIISDGTLTYTYDALYRISQVSDSDGVVASYGYDASNRRIIKIVGSTVTHSIYDASSNLIAETGADGSVSKEYIYLDGTLIDIKDYGTNAGLYYAITDNIGTPQRLITASGTVVWQASYLPFDEAQVTVSTVTNNIRFPGQYFDKETGLHYNWHRFYDPETGRYVSADPIGLNGGINLYAYVEGNPVNAFDFNGLKWIFIGWRTDFESSMVFFGRAWQLYEALFAICKECQDGESSIREIFVTDRQLSPIFGRTRNWGMVGEESDGVINASFDLGIAMRDAYTHGDKNHIEYSKKNGKSYCDQLNGNPNLGVLWTTAPSDI